MPLPFFLNSSLGKTKYHKSHHFDIYCNDNHLCVGDTKPGIGGEPRLGQKINALNSKIPKGEIPSMPAWVAFDRQVLSFDAYYLESYVERLEQYRVAKSKIYFFLEDDSIMVNEQRIADVTHCQGTIIHRHRIPKPPPDDDKFYTVEDFNVGIELNLYSKVFRIVDCDDFTLNFLRKLGVKVGAPERIPEDPFFTNRKATRQPRERYDTLKQFLDHDRHVLRFFCFWDDRESEYGDLHSLVMCYYLADDTIDIRQLLPHNSGRDAVMFLKRARVPKIGTPLKFPCAPAPRTVLNVTKPDGHEMFYIHDSLKKNYDSTEYIKDTDLTLGSVVNIWGRRIVLCDCDEFTKEYYRTKHGITEFTPLKIPHESFTDGTTMPPKKSFGSEEDTLHAYQCGFVVQHHAPNTIQFMKYDRCALDSNQLQFLACFDAPKAIDKDRLFIITCFLSDDSISVFERRRRNSGHIGGKFIKRCRIKKPNQPRFSTELPEHFQAQDLYVGATLEFFKYKFIILDADEYSLRYIDEHSEKFLNYVKDMLAKIKPVLNEKMDEVCVFITQHDPTNKGVLSYPQFQEMMKLIIPTLAEHQVRILARKFAERSQAVLDKQQVMAIVQEELRKSNYDNFDSIFVSLQYQDKNKSGFVSPETVRSVFLANHVPIPKDLLGVFFEAAPSNEKGEISYAELMNQINWRDFPIPMVQQHTVQADEWWHQTKIGPINYLALLARD
ncbi:EF-hand domain-containing family member C2-like isoform X2 [Pomacea canaliculata]|uniref:EF-hand domain-containing family member C2-like isoform X2 n=1 Tax=Pomacea canaliculata TaxID=400727 RepID=UPI000D73AC20|nr:EF-hand domain-containing family member C2-like isoform X2 [Pomacea canaliculata]